MKSPFLRLSGAGDIDIGGGQMNYLAKASVVAKQHGAGRTGAGTPERPDRAGARQRPLRGAVLQARTRQPGRRCRQAKVEEKSAEIKAKAQDQVKDKLKGLFGKSP
jgi:AsmA protein